MANKAAFRDFNLRFSGYLKRRETKLYYYLQSRPFAEMWLLSLLAVSGFSFGIVSSGGDSYQFSSFSAPVASVLSISSSFSSQPTINATITDALNLLVDINNSTDVEATVSAIENALNQQINGFGFQVANGSDAGKVVQ